MDALTRIGNILVFIIGVGLGASIMYFYEVYMDWREDKEEEQAKSRRLAK